MCVLQESREYKSGKSECPIRKKVSTTIPLKVYTRKRHRFTVDQEVPNDPFF